jgi:hypothetical protein
MERFQAHEVHAQPALDQTLARYSHAKCLGTGSSRSGHYPLRHRRRRSLPVILLHQHQHHLLFRRSLLSARLLPLLRVMRTQDSHSHFHITWQLTLRALPWPYQPWRYHFRCACVKLPQFLCPKGEQLPSLGRPDLPMTARSEIEPFES